MLYQLSDLINDSRLERLFSTDERPCAFQVWVLQLKSGNNVLENRILYARLLPYSFAQNAWSFSDNDGSQPFGSFKATVTRLNLYIGNSLCRKLLELFNEGKTIGEVSEKLNLKISRKIIEKFGNVVLISEGVIYKPVTYLENRSAHQSDTLTSPHEISGAFSASIVKENKLSLFMYNGVYNKGLVTMLVNHLDAETGMKFSEDDKCRFGDIEFLVFPTLDDYERNLLQVDWGKDKHLSVIFTSSQLPAFRCFQFHIIAENDNQIVFSKIAPAKLIRETTYEYTFKMDAKMYSLIDATKINIFAFNTDKYEEGTLVCSWKVNYVREVNVQFTVAGNKIAPIKFDWLEKTTNSKQKNRVVQALSPSNNGNLYNRDVVARESDKWIRENKALKSVFNKLYPADSDSRFFPRWGTSDGEGRLQFVEWFKALLENNHQYHIAIFDPYFEDVGLALLALYGYIGCEYTIFRSATKSKSKNIIQSGEASDILSIGVDNLQAFGKNNKKALYQKKIKVYGLKEGRLHDRYILILGEKGLPIKGYHLSNSFQKATENYPLLITSIPTDVLYLTNQYTFDLIQEANVVKTDVEEESNIKILFDSNDYPVEPKLSYNRLDFLKHNLAGTVFSVWLNDFSLAFLKGDQLEAKLNELGVLQKKSFIGISESGLFNCIREMDGKLSEFRFSWELIGEILAHSNIGDQVVEELESEAEFLLFLENYLSWSFQCEIVKKTDMQKNISVIDPNFLKRNISEIISSSIQVHHFFRYSTGYNLLTWAEFYAIKYLWKFSPGPLISLIERESRFLDDNVEKEHFVRLSILSQVVGLIAQSIELFQLSAEQEDSLIKSDVALIKWFGWHSIEKTLISSDKLAVTEGALSDLSRIDKVRFFSWMLHNNYFNSKNNYFFDCAVEQLHALLSKDVSKNELENIIDFCKGSSRELGKSGSWIYLKVLKPLIIDGRVGVEDVCEIWFRDIINILSKKYSQYVLSFSCVDAGEVLKTCAYLWAHSNSHYQRKCIEELKKIIGKQGRVLQQPLASTVNFRNCDEALKISMWILILGKLCKCNLNAINVVYHNDLDSLIQSAFRLVMIRSRSDWESLNKELLIYLDKLNGS